MVGFMKSVGRLFLNDPLADGGVHFLTDCASRLELIGLTIMKPLLIWARHFMERPKHKYKEVTMFTAKVKEKSIGNLRPIWLLAFLLIPMVALILGAAVPAVWAQDDDDDEGPIALEAAKIIIETNFTDGDAGIQVFLDGDAWKYMKIKAPNEKKIVELYAKSKLKHFGLTELFSESEEPNFFDPEDGVPLSDILARFPEGTYKFRGWSIEDEKLKGSAELSHDIPCGADNLSPSEETLENGDPVEISWNPVTTLLNDIGDACSMDPIVVEKYQVIVENVTPDGDSSGNEYSVFLPALPADNMVMVPDSFIEEDSTYKYEVLAIAENGNQTISETYFCTGVGGAFCTPPVE